MDFVVIDVETANANLSSICQVGVADFRDGLLAAAVENGVDIALGEAPVAAGRAKRAHLARVRPAAQRRLIDVQDAAGLAQRQPTVRRAGSRRSDRRCELCSGWERTQICAIFQRSVT